MKNLVYQLTTPNIESAYIINKHFYDVNARVKHGRLVSSYYGEALEFARFWEYPYGKARVEVTI